jgi:hypothetical protein
MLTLQLESWQPVPDAATQDAAVAALERGGIVYLPKLAFRLEEAEKGLVDEKSDIKLDSKSVKYAPRDRRVWGFKEEHLKPLLGGMLERFSESACSLTKSLFPRYRNTLIPGNASFRPAEVKGRVQSKRHDDTRLHVDAFPTRPSGGLRLLRVFSNVHPGDHPRVWHVGEPFPEVAGRFIPKIPAPLPGSALFLHLLGFTKARRTPYDHYMLQIHDRMKLDDQYQQTAKYQRVEFPPGSTWICFTDQVSHAALGGRYLFEQTFTVPVEAMAQPNLSPLKVVEGLVKNRG